MSRLKNLLEKAAEEIENCYGRETELSIELREYIDLEEAGRLIELPCKVGNKVYFLATDGRILDTALGDLNTVYRFKDLIGKGFYLTKAEAEAKLAELKGGEQDA